MGIYTKHLNNGFIEVLENNKTRHKESVFRFSEQWQKDKIELSTDSRTYIESEKERKEKKCKC